jgi:hypothetical protein
MASLGDLLPRPLLGEGTILREHWTNVPGPKLPVVLQFDPRYPDHPSSRMYLPSFEAPSNAGENFGARFRGYIQPPVSGKYTFWLAAWEGAELYLSPEFLVVLTIIGLLTSLILAAVARAKSAGRQTSYLSNLKQLQLPWLPRRATTQFPSLLSGGLSSGG